MKQRSLLLMLGLLWLVLSCEKNEDPKTFNPTPAITLESITPSDRIVAYQDSVVLVLGYEDGDGDLGENNDSTQNLFIQDSRLDKPYSFRIKMLAPQGAQVPIKGRLRVVLPSVGLIKADTTEQATFAIHIMDRNKNKSNTVTTNTIQIVPR
jgi:hypothetical protein